jgi:hypothetical protein
VKKGNKSAFRKKGKKFYTFLHREMRIFEVQVIEMRIFEVQVIAVVELVHIEIF